MVTPQFFPWLYQWEFQDPKMEVPYHIRPYFVGIVPYIGLNNRPKIYGIGTSNFSRFLLHGQWSHVLKDDFSSYKPWLDSYTMVTPQFSHGSTGG